MDPTAQIITSIATLLGVVGGLLVQLLALRRQRVNKDELIHGIKGVHESTNGKMDKLLEVNGVAADAVGEKRGHAAGLKEGREELR